MTLQKTIVPALIKIFVHPVFRNRPVDFKTHLKTANKILIVCSTGEKTISQIPRFIDLFPCKKAVVLHHDPSISDTNKYSIISFDTSKQKSLNLIESKLLKELAHYNFDVFLDLDSEFNLFTLYLCRFLNSRVRIGFSKLHTNWSYNLEYRTKRDLPYEKKLEGLFQFLQSFLSLSAVAKERT